MRTRTQSFRQAAPAAAPPALAAAPPAPSNPPPRASACSSSSTSPVLRCIARCTEKQEALARLPARHDEAAAVKQHAEDALRDLEIDLCNLAASFVTAPMSGLMFVPLPNEYVGEAAAQESRHAQMLGQRCPAFMLHQARGTVVDQSKCSCRMKYSAVRSTGLNCCIVTYIRECATVPSSHRRSSHKADKVGTCTTHQ